MAGLFQKVAKIDPLGRFLNKKDPILRNIDSGLGISDKPTIVTTPQVLPMPTDEDVKRAKNLASQAAQQRTGRASTILSQPTAQTGDQLGA